MKLWDKGYTINEKIETFTVGNDRELDLHLIEYDIIGSIAHAKMLCKVGLLSTAELDQLILALNDMLQENRNGDFQIEEQFEDVHSKIEFELIKRVGEAGKKIHTARSRNDQVLVDMHLYLKEEIQVIKKQVNELFELLLAKSEQYKSVLMPGYTHLQVAMPSSFGLWYGAYAECLIDDVVMLDAAYKIADQNPLGSGAGYGSSFPIDRELTTELLGFSALKYNVVAAQMSRGKLEKTVAYAISSLAGTLSKLAMDGCLYMSQNFDFIKLPKELTTGSSIMPHKQNPDVFELIRAKCNQLQVLPSELIMISNNLPSGYYRDLQMLKEPIVKGINNLKECLEMTHLMVEAIIPNESLLENPMYDSIFTVEEINKLVNEGYSFRDAYQKIGQEWMSGKLNPNKEISHTLKGSLGNLCTSEIAKKMASMSKFQE